MPSSASACSTNAARARLKAVSAGRWCFPRSHAPLLQLEEALLPKAASEAASTSCTKESGVVKDELDKCTEAISKPRAAEASSAAVPACDASSPKVATMRSRSSSDASISKLYGGALKHNIAALTSGLPNRTCLQYFWNLSTAPATSTFVQNIISAMTLYVTILRLASANCGANCVRSSRNSSRSSEKIPSTICIFAPLTRASNTWVWSKHRSASAPASPAARVAARHMRATLLTKGASAFGCTAISARSASNSGTSSRSSPGTETGAGARMSTAASWSARKVATSVRGFVSAATTDNDNSFSIRSRAAP
mmetsp:Transcript_6863/g.19261  ORF Transcript_6863/g.19261 Transcript_6863/m.19261 type:complete len:310 (+) Transcript_6863:420-1349(+)